MTAIDKATNVVATEGSYGFSNTPRAKSAFARQTLESIASVPFENITEDAVKEQFKLALEVCVGLARVTLAVINDEVTAEVGRATVDESLAGVRAELSQTKVPRALAA